MFEKISLVQDEIAPVAAKHDETGEFPWALVKKAHELGLMNSQIPEKYGKIILYMRMSISLVICALWYVHRLDVT